MKTCSLTRARFAFAALLLPLSINSCGKQDAALAEEQSIMAQQKLADERRALELERLRLNQERLEADKAKSESERIKTENELRVALTRIEEQQKELAQNVEVPAPETPDKDTHPEATINQPQPQPPIPPPVLTPETSLNSTVSFEPFYNELDGQDGNWFESPDYGYVWQPVVAVNNDWAPYTEGGWTYSDYGWTWESQESFGPVCYHYGRWAQLPQRGWVWVPGRDWAPAWVSWRTSDNCIGWAPLPPEARWNSSLGIQSWSDAVYHLSPTSYCFVSLSNFTSRSCRSVLLPRSEANRNFLACRNVTRLEERRHAGGPASIYCGGPSFETLKAKLGDGLREKKLAFQTAGKKQDGNDSAADRLTIHQFNLAKAQRDELKQSKPARVKEKWNSPSAPQRATSQLAAAPQSPAQAVEIRRRVMQEAAQSVRSLPPARGNGTRSDGQSLSSNPVAPKPGNKLEFPPTQPQQPLTARPNVQINPATTNPGQPRVLQPNSNIRPQVQPGNIRPQVTQSAPSKPSSAVSPAPTYGSTQSAVNPQNPVAGQIQPLPTPPASPYNNTANLQEILRQRQEAAAQFEAQRQNISQNPNPDAEDLSVTGPGHPMTGVSKRTIETSSRDRQQGAQQSRAMENNVSPQNNGATNAGQLQEQLQARRQRESQASAESSAQASRAAETSRQQSQAAESARQQQASAQAAQAAQAAQSAAASRAAEQSRAADSARRSQEESQRSAAEKQREAQEERSKRR